MTDETDHPDDEHDSALLTIAQRRELRSYASAAESDNPGAARKLRSRARPRVAHGIQDLAFLGDELSGECGFDDDDIAQVAEMVSYPDLNRAMSFLHAVEVQKFQSAVNATTSDEMERRVDELEETFDRLFRAINDEAKPDE